MITLLFVNYHFEINLLSVDMKVLSRLSETNIVLLYKKYIANLKNCQMKDALCWWQQILDASQLKS